MDATSTQEGRDEAMRKLIQDMSAASSSSTSSSYWTTWNTFGRHWFGASFQPLPVTPNAIMCIAAVFKAGGYRSFESYVADARGRHIDAGYPWSQLLMRTAKRATRAVTR